MDSQSLANLSNLILYGAMGILALTMIAFAVHLAYMSSPKVVRGPAAQRERTPVSVGAASADAPEFRADGPAGREPPVSAPAHPDAADRADLGTRAGGTAMSLAWLGTLLLGFSIVLRGLSVRRAPVSNMFEFACAASLLVLLVYLVLAMRRPLRWLGLFIVTPVLLALGLAITVWYTLASELVPSLKSTWLVIHVPVAILSTAIFTVAFCVLLLHLWQARAEAFLAADRPVRFRGLLSTLPDSASLDRTAYSLVVVAFPLWTFTLIAGAIWGQQAWGTYWSWDPKEVWTFVIWTIYAAYLHARATSGWSLRTANTIAVVGYLAIIVNFTIVNYYFPGMHSYSGLVSP
ncbi:MAG: c-type cytochrome biogenesis protein CcsB [Micrococcales bacterium]|nr:c-type cytochrome biogenesis protein CcsB [Micrococcales bacterium]